MRCLKRDSFVVEYVVAMLPSFATSAIYVILAGLKIVFSTFMSVLRRFESGVRMNRESFFIHVYK